MRRIKNCFIIMMIGVASLMTACSMNNEKKGEPMSIDTTTEITTEKTKVQNIDYVFEGEERILFVDSYVNFAWGIQRKAKVITNKGNIYTVDYSEDEREIPILEMIIADGVQRGNQKYTDEKIREMYMALINIDVSKREKSSLMACDAGCYLITGFIYNEDGSYSTIEVIEDGDSRYTIEDDNATTIVMELWGKDRKI